MHCCVVVLSKRWEHPLLHLSSRPVLAFNAIIVSKARLRLCCQCCLPAAALSMPISVSKYSLLSVSSVLSTVGALKVLMSYPPRGYHLYAPRRRSPSAHHPITLISTCSPQITRIGEVHLSSRSVCFSTCTCNLSNKASAVPDLMHPYPCSQANGCCSIRCHYINL
jgi:hypothetical protein